MKQCLKKIVGAIIILLCSYQRFCYANSVVSDPSEEFMPIGLLISFISVVVLLVLLARIIAVRISKNKKIPQIITTILIFIICIVEIWNFYADKLATKYNEQFLQYEEHYTFTIESFYYVSDTEALINAVISNNMNNKNKVSIMYEDTSYSSVDELKKLLDIYNKDRSYDMHEEYNSNKFIKTIELVKLKIHIPIFDNLYRYEGEYVKGANVRALINMAMNYGLANENLSVNITYTSDTNQTTKKEANKGTMEEIETLRKEISTSKTYKIEVEGKMPEDSDDKMLCDIIITANTE